MADDGTARAADRGVLRVCADPNNMPFSNANGDGFENKLAELVAAELGKDVAYTWATQDGGFIGDTLRARRCDVIVGVPDQFRPVAVTRPYYWSSYVLVSRADRGLRDVTSLKDHRIRNLKIAVPSIGGNKLFSPPAQVLNALKLDDRIVAYPIDGADDARIVDAVVRGDVDMAALWGPAAGYFVQHSPVPLVMTMIGDTDEFSSRKTHLRLLGLQFEIGMGVRPTDHALRQQLDGVIARKQPEISALLKRFGVPLIEPARLAGAARSDDGRAE
ncbi:MAG: quinoprotein dehydrogenase-associated putative ABC transporter substrate-binding protein [Alphaproteobacteria bacterium]